jgi:hypothetical protein
MSTTNLSSLEEVDIIAPNIPAIFVLAYTAQGELVSFANGVATGW